MVASVGPNEEPNLELQGDTLYGVVFFRFSTQTPNLATLKTQIEALDGVAEIDLLIDHITELTSSLPTDWAIGARVKVDLDLMDAS